MKTAIAAIEMIVAAIVVLVVVEIALRRMK
jgi:hypothetical protein